MAMISMRAVDYSAVCERLRSPETLKLEDIEELRREVVNADVAFDKHHKLKDVVDRLHRAVTNSKCEKCSEYLSSNDAEMVIDGKTHQTLFIAKYNYLSQGRQFCVPESQAVAREHLYYLLDRNNFAGVPPTFRVFLNSLNQSLNLYCESHESVTCASSEHQMKLGIHLRRCFIHQFRTVNMDPSSGNILIPSNREILNAFPIDGGYCLPERFSKSRLSFDLVSHSLNDHIFYDEQFSEEEKAYIENIDIGADKKLIGNHIPLLEGESLKIFEVANKILKAAVAFEKRSNSGDVVISLRDLSIIWNERDPQNLEVSLFEFILSSKEKSVEERIDKVFKDIIGMKRFIQENKMKGPEEIIDGLHRMHRGNMHEGLLRKVSFVYALGYVQYYRLLERKSDDDPLYKAHEMLMK